MPDSGPNPWPGAVLLGHAKSRRAGQCGRRAIYLATLGIANGGAQPCEPRNVILGRYPGYRRAATAPAAVGLHRGAVFGAPADPVFDRDLHVQADTDQPLQRSETADIGGESHIDSVAAKRRPEEIPDSSRADHEVGFALGKAVSPIGVEEDIDALPRRRALPAPRHRETVNPQILDRADFYFDGVPSDGCSFAKIE